MVLFQLNFAGGQVLQKYYKVATHAGDATLHKETVTTAPPVTLATRQRAIAKTKHTQILEIAIRERATSDLDNFIRVNPVVNPNTGSTAARVSPIYVVAILFIFGIVLCFIVCIVLAVLSEGRPQGDWGVCHVVGNCPDKHGISLMHHVRGWVGVMDEVRAADASKHINMIGLSEKRCYVDMEWRISIVVVIPNDRGVLNPHSSSLSPRTLTPHTRTHTSHPDRMSEFELTLR